MNRRAASIDERRPKGEQTIAQVFRRLQSWAILFPPFRRLDVCQTPAGAAGNPLQSSPNGNFFSRTYVKTYGPKLLVAFLIAIPVCGYSQKSGSSRGI
jgi:hypothetical protein